MLFDLDGNHIKDISHIPCFNNGILLQNNNVLLSKQAVQGIEKLRLAEISQEGDTLATNKNNFFFNSENPVFSRFISLLSSMVKMSFINSNFRILSLPTTHRLTNWITDIHLILTGKCPLKRFFPMWEIRPRGWL